jgi:hypothetical protein
MAKAGGTSAGDIISAASPILLTEASSLALIAKASNHRFIKYIIAIIEQGDIA